MADRKERSQLLGDGVREGAVLIAALYPLETIISVQFDPKGTVDWGYILLAEVLAGILFGFGVILEGREGL